MSDQPSLQTFVDQGQKAGYLITPNMVGKVLFDHHAARCGRLVRLSLEEILGDHVIYRTDDERQGSVVLEDSRSWLIISYAVARQEIEEYYELKIRQAKDALQQAESGSTQTQEELKTAEAQFDDTVVLE